MLDILNILSNLTGVIKNNSTALFTFIAGSVLTPALALLTPFGNALITRRLARRPVFALLTTQIGPTLKLKVRPLNKLARKKRPLFGQISGVMVGKIADCIEDEEGLLWIADLSKPHIRPLITKQNETEVKFFLDADLVSEPMAVSLQLGDATTFGRIVYADNIASFIKQVSRDARIVLSFETDTIDKHFAVSGNHCKWIGVHDGQELALRALQNCEIIGTGTTVLSASRYAWVLNLIDCKDMIISDVTLGHLQQGFCRGGVLRLQNCQNIQIRDCDLFGCGTVGLETDNCQNVLISNTTIRDCSYGIYNSINSTRIVFSQCKFINNQEFDLLTFSGKRTGIHFKECSFVGNRANKYMFRFDAADKNDEFPCVFVNDCTIKGNQYVSLSNDENTMGINNLISEQNLLIDP
ncbi:right-handed parallel beta-helix repeat-containing protein [Methylobacterium sp. WL19]|uniref:right-handed parallel beta-helix repeat-containing protein n=1 Tax=Methylobacterium sp. WL19 TaxID=2603896 RepID=UPI0011CB1668|nr:right-handed parallel beta-helix repeat-containing protein [Methylobacterium sp. WL19]TXN27391.1 right-handed parallel beta-helix repeat-containing protein [Methylobacterium sp. WL19]